MKGFVPKISALFCFLLTFFTMTSRLPAGASDDLTGMLVSSDQELSTLRGGFVSDDGLLVSFGIERAVYVNGVLDAASRLTISRIDGTGGSQSLPATAQGAHPVNLIQIGTAGSDVFSPDKIIGSNFAGGFTVIQNSLNNQIVRNITTINASVTNMNLFRNINLTSSISQQVIHGIH